MKYRCGLCQISPSSDGFTGTREEVIEHLEAHNVLDVELYLTPATKQTTL